VAGYGKHSGTTPATFFTIDKKVLAIDKIGPGPAGIVFTTRRGVLTIVFFSPAFDQHNRHPKSKEHPHERTPPFFIR
jgi:hypothetical protein